jgi:hypothetical protein
MSFASNRHPRAWLMHLAAKNLRSFLKGQPWNVVN